jgi:BirA family biotin operon repressor/biotin-[acetyl-CoA-carboxylase] ligase
MNDPFSTQANDRGLWLEECASTNSELNAHALQGAPHGFWIAAKKQTAGRGRAGNVWVSEEGNLFLSVLIRDLTDFALWTWIPLIAALATRDAVLELRPELADRLKVKWPNDLWLNHRKCCGILCEGHGSGSGSYIVVGIGLNALRAPTLAERAVAFVELAPTDLQPRVVAQVLRRVRESNRDKLLADWRACTEFAIGSRVEWVEKQGGVKIGEGRVYGLGDYGELRVLLNDGSIQSLFSEEVSLKAAAGASDESPL